LVVISPAYFAPGVAADAAAAMPCFRRILPAGPWQVASYNHPVQGWGAMAWWVGCAQPEDLPDWRASPDGLWYCGPAALPGQAELARPNAPRGIEVPVTCGAMLTMPLATLAPRRVSLLTGQLGEPADEYGRLGYAVSARLRAAGEAGLPVTDREVLRFLTAGLALAYRVTAEMIEDLGWVTTADVDPLLCAALGHDPKASEPAATSSPSHAAGSST
jgi:hypothetical protein